MPKLKIRAGEVELREALFEEVGQQRRPHAALVI